MTSLVEEVQAAAIDQHVPLAVLLRKAKALSFKLDAPDISAWIERELNGYTDVDELPAYRQMLGQPKFFNPAYGRYFDLSADTPHMQSAMSSAKICEPVSSIEVIVHNGAGTSVHLSYPPEIQVLIMSGADLSGMKPSIQIPKSALFSVLDVVRNKVLDWALALEAKGVLGEGMTFSTEDKELAAEVTNNYVTNIYGDVTNSQLQQATENSSQTQTNIDFEQAEQIADNILNDIDKFDLEKDAVVKLNGDLDTIKTNLRTTDPDIDVIRQAFRSARNILEGAAGSVLATGYATEISAFLGSIPNILPA